MLEQPLAPYLTGPEAIAVHGGYGWSAGHQYDRHNVLAAELGLRVCEFTGMTVLGENYASVDLLAGAGLGGPPVHAGGKTGNAVLVCDDGLRIVVELTASRSAGLESKMDRWAQLLHEHPVPRRALLLHRNARRHGRN